MLTLIVPFWSRIGDISGMVEYSAVHLVYGLVDEASIGDIVGDLGRLALGAGHILDGYGRQGRDQVGIDSKVEGFGCMGNNRKAEDFGCFDCSREAGVMAFGRLTFDLTYVSELSPQRTLHLSSSLLLPQMSPTGLSHLLLAMLQSL
ncbi:hypothetical protein K7X08_026684 [Anisodus acutangulus]|uniref:Uncharacterized protein n=1 Tax=Anisodus acutangulus TaxID=402998 RepID=A0A9Q1QW57_9SOLA|nr:hypothetical protein K7X08_026684 [Anisodus acutangulus]